MRVQKITRTKLRSILLGMDMTFRDFARAEGVKYNTLDKILGRHVGKKSKPRGELTLRVLERLDSYVEGRRHA